MDWLELVAVPVTDATGDPARRRGLRAAIGPLPARGTAAWIRRRVLADGPRRRCRARLR
jgi:hypothetical protein